MQVIRLDCALVAAIFAMAVGCSAKGPDSSTSTPLCEATEPCIDVELVNGECMSVIAPRGRRCSLDDGEAGVCGVAGECLPSCTTNEGKVGALLGADCATLCNDVADCPPSAGTAPTCSLFPASPGRVCVYWPAS